VITVDDGCCDVSEVGCAELGWVEVAVLLTAIEVEDILWGRELELCCWDVVTSVDDCMVDVEMGVEEVN